MSQPARIKGRGRKGPRQKWKVPRQDPRAEQGTARPGRRGHCARDRRRAHCGAGRASARSRRRADRRLPGAAVGQHRAGGGPAAHVGAADAVPTRPLADPHQTPRAEDRRGGFVPRPDHRGARREGRILHAERAASPCRRQGARSPADHGAHLARRRASRSGSSRSIRRRRTTSRTGASRSSAWRARW